MTEPFPYTLSNVCKLQSKKNSGYKLISPAIFRSFFRDLLCIVQHAHSNSMILRTLDPSQFVLSEAGMIKFLGVHALHYNTTNNDVDGEAESDGLESCSRDKSKETVYSSSNLNSTAPEMILGSRNFSKASDVWTVACMMGGLLVGKPLFSGKERGDVMKSISKICGTISSTNFENGKKFSEYKKLTVEKKYKKGVEKALAAMLGGEIDDGFVGGIKMLAKMLTLDPLERWSVENCLNDEYFGGEKAGRWGKDWKEMIGRLGVGAVTRLKGKGKMFLGDGDGGGVGGVDVDVDGEGEGGGEGDGEGNRGDGDLGGLEKKLRSQSIDMDWGADFS